MDIKEVTKAERDAWVKKFKKEAERLTGGNPDPYVTWIWFLSDGGAVYSLRKWPPEKRDKYKGYYKPKVQNIFHFLPHACNKTMPGEIACCMASVRKGNKWHYYYCEHEVGDCPHKEI